MGRQSANPNAVPVEAIRSSAPAVFTAGASIGEERSGEAAGRDRARDGPPVGQSKRRAGGGDQEQRAGGFHRRSFDRRGANPFPAEQKDQRGNGVRREPENLQAQIGGESSDPSRQIRGPRRAGGRIPGGIGRLI